MTTLLVIIWVILAVSLIAIVSVRPVRSHRSWFELQRLQDMAVMRREELFADVIGVRRVLTGLLLIGLTLIGLQLWQSWGVIATISIWICSGALARWKPLHVQIMKRYVSLEPRILDILESAALIGWLFRTQQWHHDDPKLESSEQLLDLVKSAGHILSPDQQTIIRQGIGWHKTTVETIMTPAKDIIRIGYRELLGPLVLDDLHRSGHDLFPVINENINTVVGILNITQMLEVDATKRSQTAEKAMSPNALRIESDKPLPAALELLQKSHQHLLIVVDTQGKTVGLVTLADVTGSLLGQNRGEVIK